MVLMISKPIYATFAAGLYIASFVIITLSCRGDHPTEIGVPPFTTPEFWDDTPAWSPDGRLIAYTYFARSIEEARDFGQEQVWLYDAEADSNYRFIYPGFIPRWSPDATILAFTFPAGGFGDIYFYYIEQDTVVRITYNGHQNYYDFAPDGNSLVMPPGVVPRLGTGLWLVDLEGNFHRNLIPEAAAQMPRWSWYSGNVLYVRFDSNYSYQIAISDTLGNSLGRVHPSVWVQYTACWGPGDSVIAIVAINHPSINFIPSSSIWLKNTNSGDFDFFSMGQFADWSSDGEWLAIVEEGLDPYRWTIWIMRPDGSDRREISQWYPDDDTTTVARAPLNFPRCALTHEQKRRLGFRIQ